MIADELEEVVKVEKPVIVEPPPRRKRKAVTPRTRPEEIASLEEKEGELAAKIKDLSEKRDELEEVVARMRRTLDAQNRERWRKAEAEKAEKAAVMEKETKVKNERDANARYNELWGEKQQLREVLAKIHLTLKEERALQERCAEMLATAQWQAEKRDEV
jgi:uncharacterized coiled-coil DUF342 family protein